eukprot:s978_g17.t1
MAEEQEEIEMMPLHSDFGASGFRPYVLDLLAADLAGEGLVFTLAFIVMRRQGGMLLALPELALSAEVQRAGNAAGSEEMIGPSTKVEVQAAALDEDAVQHAPVAVDGRALTVLLVDVSEELAIFMRAVEGPDDLTEVMPFEVPEDHLIPLPEDLVERALAWARGADEGVSERIQYYSAEEVPETPPDPGVRRQSRRRGPAGSTGGGAPGAAAPKRKVTVAQLAESLAAVTETLPQITTKLQELSERTTMMEQEFSGGLTKVAGRPSALRKPLASSATPGSPSTLTPASLIREMPPPRGSVPQPKAGHVKFSQAEVEDLSSDFPQDSNDLGKAMLEQSRALTLLVSQLTANSTDPFSDLSASSSSLSSKGSMGRAKLQNELAAHKGIFFSSVIQSMARRMQPSQPSEVSGSGCKPETLRTDSESALGHNSTSIPEGVRRHIDTQSRGVGNKECQRQSEHQQHQQCRSAKAEGKGQSRRKGKACESECGESRGGAAVTDEERLSEEISFQRFLACLPRWISRSRTKFSFLLARSFHIQRAGVCPLSAVFPIPVPHIGLFGGQEGSKLSASKWKRLCFKRALHVVVVALNYIHSGMRPFPLALLGRSPNQTHLAIYKRLRALLTACDRCGSHPMPPGRSGPEFIARLVELEHFASSNAACNPDPYAGAHDAGPLPISKVGTISEEHAFQVTEQFSPIQPYRSLITERLKITGEGKWPIEEFIDGILWLPFCEPAVLRHEEPVTWEGPDMSREDRAQNLALAKVWDAKGLLSLHHQNPYPQFSSRVFNAHKSLLVDRQIGDRRWFNGFEHHPCGPSSMLPSGSAIASISCPTKFKLVGCASDRKDFYHQAKVTRERAVTNLLPFSFSPEEFQGSAALEELYAEVGRKKGRDETGDRYGMQPRSVLAPADIREVHCGFKSLFQGDHLGVEFALVGHCNLLKEAGLLEEDSWVRRHHPFPVGPLWQGVVIDDFFCVSKEAAATPNLEAASVRCLEKAEEIYKEQDVLGSDEKTVRGEENFKIIGAEVLADSKTRSAGLVTVSAPAAKRIPMACLSLKLAAMPIISRALASRAAGNWVSIFMQCIADR